MEFLLTYVGIGIISVVLTVRSEVKKGVDIEVKVNDLGYLLLIVLLWPILVCAFLGEAWSDSSLKVKIERFFRNFGNIKLMEFKSNKDEE